MKKIIGIIALIAYLGAIFILREQKMIDNTMTLAISTVFMGVCILIGKSLKS